MRGLAGVKCSSSILSGGLVAGLQKAAQKACVRPLMVKYRCLGMKDGFGWLKLGAIDAVLDRSLVWWLEFVGVDVVFDLVFVCCFDDLN